MKDLEEFAICNDIVSRMATIALAKACENGEIQLIFKVIGKAVAEKYPAPKVKKLADMYEKATVDMAELMVGPDGE